MADSDKDISIAPNRGLTGLPEIYFSGSGAVPIRMKVLDDADGTLSWEGSAGQLFSVNNNLTDGTVFSVNTASGIPAIDVNADGTVTVAGFTGNVGIGVTAPSARLHVGGGVLMDGGVTFSGVISGSTAGFSRLVTFGGGLSAAGGITFAGLTRITDTTASSSTTTGALVVSGGAGIAGAVRATDGFIGTPIQRVTGFNGLLDDCGVCTLTGSIAVGAGGQGAWVAAYCPTNDRIYVGNNGSPANAVSVINPATQSVERTVAVPVAAIVTRSLGIAYCPTNNSMYLADYENDRVIVIDCATDAITTIAVGDNPSGGIAYCPTNNTMYVGNANDDDVSPIDCATNTKGTDIAVGDNPRGLCYCPTNNTMYVSNGNDDDVSPIDCATNTKGTDIAVGDNPRDLAYCRTNNRIYVCNRGDDDVSVIDPSSNTLDGSDIAVGDQCAGIAFNARNGFLYVVNGNANTVSIINPTIGTGLVVQTISYGGTADTAIAGRPAFCPSNGRVYIPHRTSSVVRVLT